jgi:hypothetical protein
MLAAHLDFAFVLAGGGQAVGTLHVQPRLFRTAEGLGKANRHFRGDAGFAVNDFVEGLPRDAENFRPSRDREAERLKAIMQNYAGRDAPGFSSAWQTHSIGGKA